VCSAEIKVCAIVIKSTNLELIFLTSQTERVKDFRTIGEKPSQFKVLTRLLKIFDPIVPLCTLPSCFYEKFSVRELRKNELQVCALNHTRANYNFSIAHLDDRLKLIEKRNLAKEDGFRQ
jgi:hypothetical protein